MIIIIIKICVAFSFAEGKHCVRSAAVWLWFNFCSHSPVKVASLNIASFPAARELEKAGELKQAIAVYKKLLRTPSTALPALTRLMMIYRKQKKYEDERIVIDKAIAIHQKHYLAVKPRNTKADKLSRELNAVLGLADEKGKTYYKPDEILKLEKRKRFVLGKIR